MYQRHHRYSVPWYTEVSVDEYLFRKCGLGGFTGPYSPDLSSADIAAFLELKFSPKGHYYGTNMGNIEGAETDQWDAIALNDFQHCDRGTGSSR